MMTSRSELEEDQFFDTLDEIASVSDLGSDCFEDCSSSGHLNGLSNGFGYGLWDKNLESVNERRHRFLRWMGLSSDWNQTEKGEEDISSDELSRGINSSNENRGREPVSVNLFLEDRFSSNQSSRSCRSDDGTELVVKELIKSEIPSSLCEAGLDRMIPVEEFQRTLGSSSLVHQFVQRDNDLNDMLDARKKVKKGWLQKLSVMTRVVHRQDKFSLNANEMKSNVGARINRVPVHSYKKQLKELSSLYTGQEFRAHQGPILTMKFSPDGQFLASAGEDHVVRVWNVIEDEGPRKFIQETDSSCLYFSLNRLSKLAPLNVDKEKSSKMKRLRKSSESTCVIIPPTVFRLSEKPVHEFHGHRGDILALSWSKKGHLLSSSVDKTVRLWQLGHIKCQRVFSHNNYVTCVEFNPEDDNYFISGSIDGKVRIWEVHGCQVIDWIDIREIVSAVCYCPNGKGGIIGSMDGNCHFYDIIDNRLQLGAQLCLQGKKKLPGKRITGFQFSPSHPSKVMVSSADSQVRILSGAGIISKFKGTRSSGSQASACFTSDGKHIVSATENSNVCIWNYMNQDRTFSQAKNILSCESFFSPSASIAIPWCCTKSMPLPSPASSRDHLSGSIFENKHFGDDLFHKMPVSSPDCFRGFFLEPLHRGSTTWPEEKLPDSCPVSPSICKSKYKVLKAAYQTMFTSPHTWGLVIVTAGRDGRIRTYLNYGLPVRS